jgi:microcin C transport system ATP-binding protein
MVSRRLSLLQGLCMSGPDVAALGQRQLRPLRREMEVVFQDPFSTSLSPRLSVAQIVEEGLKVHRLATGGAERRRLIETASAEVGLDPRPPSATRTSSRAASASASQSPARRS